MIDGYFRPKNVDEAIAILRRKDGHYRPLGGGVTISQEVTDQITVVDLQALGLDTLEKEGQFLSIGATVKLQSLAEFPVIQPSLMHAIMHEVNINLRQQATAAGALIVAGGRSSFSTAMLALDATLTWQPGDMDQPLGDWLVLKHSPGDACLVTKIKIPLNPTLVFEKVARTPADLPILCVAAARWPSGRTRITLGGFGIAPILAFDAPEPGGAVEVVRDALSKAEDSWASADYRQDIGGKIIQRLLQQ